MYSESDYISSNLDRQKLHSYSGAEENIGFFLADIIDHLPQMPPEEIEAIMDFLDAIEYTASEMIFRYSAASPEGTDAVNAAFINTLSLLSENTAKFKKLIFEKSVPMEFEEIRSIFLDVAETLNVLKSIAGKRMMEFGTGYSEE